MKRFNTAACLAELLSIETLLSNMTTKKTSRCPGGLQTNRSTELSTCLASLLDPTISTELGQTCLHLAASEGLRACTEALVHAGGGVLLYARDHQGHTPLDRARIAGHRDTASSTELGQTCLHLAASEGLRACTEALVHAGGGVLLYARDHQGHTPLDRARIAGHRDTARYLKDVMWKQDQHTDMQKRRVVNKLRLELIHQARENDHREKEERRGLVEENMTEWATRKGLQTLQLETPSQGPPSRYHIHCTLLEPGPPQPGPAPGSESRPQPEPDKHKHRSGGGPKGSWNISTNPAPRPPPSSLSSPAPPEAEPDLRSSVVLLSGAGRGAAPRYTTRWSGGVAAPLPALPADVLERLLFPGGVERPPSPRGSVLDLPSLGRGGGATRDHSASPWTEVAMHLAETLEPGHY